MTGNSVLGGSSRLLASIPARPDGSFESGGGVLAGGGVGAPSADLFRILEQASDAASIRIEPVPGVGGGPKGVSSPSSLANVGLPVGIPDPSAIVAASARGTKAGIKSLPPASNKAAAAPNGATPKKRRGWKKPEGRPSRPLSAYNLFFQAEREAMVSEKKIGGGDDNIKKEEGESGGQRPTKRRRRGPPTGIGFATMAQTIAAKWKSLQGPAKAPFEKKAAVDRERYERQMAVWKETDDFKKYEAERKRNARNRAKSNTTNANTAEIGASAQGGGKPISVQPTPLPPGALGDDGLTPLQRMFQEGNGSGSGAGGAKVVVSPEMMAAQGRGQQNHLPRLPQQYLGPLQQQGQGQQVPGSIGQVTPLPNAEALCLQQQHQLQLQMGGAAPFHQHFEPQQSQLAQQQQQSQPSHQVTPDVNAAAKEQALLAQQQRQLRLIQEQELQGLGFGQDGVPSSMQAQPPPSQDPLLQQLLQQQQREPSLNHPGAPAHSEEELLLQQLRRDSLTTGAATTSAPSSSAGNTAGQQRGSLGLDTLFAPSGKRDSLRLGGNVGKRDSLGLGSIFDMTTSAGQRGSLGLETLFPPSGAVAGHRGSLELGGGLAGVQPPGSLPLSIQQVPQAQENVAARQQHPPGQGDGRMSLQQMLRLQKLKRQQQDEAAIASATGTQEQQQHKRTDQETTEPVTAPVGGPSSLLDLHQLQQQQQLHQLQRQQQQQQQQLQLLQQQHGGSSGGVPGLAGAPEAPQSLTGPPPLLQQHGQDEDLAMFANMFQQEG